MYQSTFIRLVEYWTPSEDGSLLEFAGGLFGNAPRFAAASRHMCFGKGEGLPGRVWETGGAIMLTSLEDNYFRRAQSAHIEGLICCIAMPIFSGGKLACVMVFFCGSEHAHAGAIELWANQPSQGKDMKLVDGYYGTTEDTFEFLSRHTAFREGIGLPGMTWQQQAPVFLPDLGKASGFVRHDSAARAGLGWGLAIPCSTLNGSNQVLVFLSARMPPIANKVGLWALNAAGTQFTRSHVQLDTVAQDTADELDINDTLNQKTLFSGKPLITESTIAIPIAPRGKVNAVMALTL